MLTLSAKRLHDDGGDVAGIVQGHQALEFEGQVGAVLGLTAAERVAGQIMGVGQVVDAGGHHRRPSLAVGRHPTQRHAAEIHAMIGALTGDEAGARTFAAQTVVLQCDLQRRLDGFGAGVDEEHMVHALRGDLDDLVGQFKGHRMTHLERRGEVHLLQRAGDRLTDLGAAVAGVDAPQTGHAIENLPAFRGPVVHALGMRQQARLVLEVAVGRKRHPMGFKVLTGQGAGAGDDGGLGVHG